MRRYNGNVCFTYKGKKKIIYKQINHSVNNMGNTWPHVFPTTNGFLIFNTIVASYVKDFEVNKLLQQVK